MSRLRQQVAQVEREVAQLQRNNADAPSVVTQGNATPIVQASDLAQLKGKMETLEKTLRDTRNRLNFSLIKCNDLKARCDAQDGELKDLRHRVQDLDNKAKQARDKDKAHTQRAHTNKVTAIESYLAKANAAKVRLQIDVKESKERVAELEAELRTRLDVETQMTLKIKAANEDKKNIGKRLVRAQDKAAQGTTPKLRSCSVT